MIRGGPNWREHLDVPAVSYAVLRRRVGEHYGTRFIAMAPWHSIADHSVDLAVRRAARLIFAAARRAYCKRGSALAGPLACAAYAFARGRRTLH